MIAVTQISLQKIFLDRRRPAVGDGRAHRSSGFGSNVTYIVGSVATRIGVRPTSGSSPGGVGARSSHAGPPAGCRGPCPVRRALPDCDLAPSGFCACLGQGRTGDVWKAKRTEPCVEIVALKILNPALAALPWRLAQFRREAERGARMAGPSLLPVFEFGEVEGCVYMAMPFVEGTTLQEVIRQRRARLKGEDFVPVHRLIGLDDDAYLRSAVRIMAHAARRSAMSMRTGSSTGTSSRRTSSSTPIGPHGVYLCDLGLGRDLEVATPEQMRDGAGTPMYMAPERLLRAPADEVLCDLYSLGVTLFETFTLGRPFHPPDGMPLACLSAYLAHAEPRRPADVRPGIPPDLALLVQKAMSRHPRRSVQLRPGAGRRPRPFPRPLELPTARAVAARPPFASRSRPAWAEPAENPDVRRPSGLIGAVPGDRLDWSRFTPQARHS